MKKIKINFKLIQKNLKIKVQYLLFKILNKLDQRKMESKTILNSKKKIIKDKINKGLKFHHQKLK